MKYHLKSITVLFALQSIISHLSLYIYILNFFRLKFIDQICLLFLIISVPNILNFFQRHDHNFQTSRQWWSFIMVNWAMTPSMNLKM
jgi:hypothetical protein